MEIKAKKHQGYLCVLCPENLIQPVARVVRGRLSKTWKCVVAAWSSVNCLALKQGAEKYGWTITAEPDFYRASAPLESSVDNSALLQDTENRILVEGRRLWAHQREAFAKLSGLTGCIFDMGMGTGKGLSSITTILSGKHDLVMVVCPKSVVPVWPAEFKKHCRLDVMTYTGPKQKSASVAKWAECLQKEMDLACALKKPLVFVVNYEKIWQSALADLLLRTKFDVIVYDEAHRLKGQNGTASKFAAKLQRNADRIIGCTGTLLPHSPMDAFGICRAIDPALFGAHFIAFKSRYAIMGGFEGKQVVGYQNEQELHDKLAMISYRIRTEDAVDLPPAQHIVRTFELGPKTRKVYDKMHNEMCVEIEGHDLTAANAMVKVLRLQQITSGIMPDSEGELVRLGTEKRDLFADMLEDIPTDEPVVVFCRFTADILAVREAAAAQNRAVYELSGKENELATWQAEKRGVLAVQIRAGKEGVDFTIASIAFYYSIGHSLGDYDQSLRRNHRPGQTRPVVYYHLVAKDTVDEEVYASLDKKRDVVEYILETLKRR